MKVKPGQVLTKAAVLLDSLVTPHSSNNSERKEQHKQESSSSLSLEDEPGRGDRRYSGGNMDEIMASLLVENVNMVATSKKDKDDRSEDLN